MPPYFYRSRQVIHFMCGADLSDLDEEVLVIAETKRIVLAKGLDENTETFSRLGDLPEE